MSQQIVETIRALNIKRNTWDGGMRHICRLLLRADIARLRSMRRAGASFKAA